MSKLKETAQRILDKAGVKINGKNPWDIQVKNENFYKRVLSGGTLALGESYMDGWWDSKDLDEFFNKVLKVNLAEELKKDWKTMLHLSKAKILNLQNKNRAFEVGEKHYDAGNDLYKKMLDKRMVYTCGYWDSGAKTLDKAQEAKLDLVCKKVGLKKGDKILDIGCGWGSFLKFAAEKYGIKGVGITISKEQQKLAQENCKDFDIEIRLQDYREVNEKFDHIISLGMFEHVGVKNYKEYFKVAERCLKDDGLFLLHTIGSNKSKHTTDPWIAKYIFPNSMLPSIKQIAEASEGLFVCEDLHNFGSNYDLTLMKWFKNFNESWDKIKDNYDERFYRMWKYYLLCCAGLFRARQAQLWQFVFSKKGFKGGYKSLR